MTPRQPTPTLQGLSEVEMRGWLSLGLVLTALIHLVLCPTLVFGWGPIPGLGVPGAAVSLLVATSRPS